MNDAVSSDVAASAIEGMLPPHDDEAEKVVLSAVMLDPSALPKIQDFLRHDMFFSEAHRRIFEAAAEIRRRKEPVDVTTVHGWLLARGTKRENRLAQVGGAGYLAEILETSPEVANVRAHAVLVHDAWRRREVIKACLSVAANGYAGVGDVQAWCDTAVRTLGTIGMQNPVRPVETNEQTYARILADACLEPGAEGDSGAAALTGFPTGFYAIDRILGGVRKGGKTTIAATTGVGKTAIALQIAVKLAKDGLGVFFFSTELKRIELLRRAVACEAGLDATRIRDRKLTPSEKVRLADATARLEHLPLRIDQTARITIEEIAGATRAMAEEMPYRHRVNLGVVIVDYIQRLEPSRHKQHQDKHLQVEHATRSLKILAQELDIVAIELAQQKDPPPGKKPQRPTLSPCCICDSSQIQKESDDLIFLHADDDPKHTPQQTVTAIVAKQRAGGKGDVVMTFQRDQYRFIDPNTPNPMASPSRQYLDTKPDPEPPPGHFDNDYHPLTEGL